MCVGCQNSRPKKELIRIVRSPEGVYSVDTTGKKSGRGAYLCPDQKCFENAWKAKRLERSFRDSIDPEVYDSLKQELRQIGHG